MFSVSFHNSRAFKSMMSFDGKI